MPSIFSIVGTSLSLLLQQYPVKLSKEGDRLLMVEHTFYEPEIQVEISRFTRFVDSSNSQKGETVGLNWFLSAALVTIDCKIKECLNL